MGANIAASILIVEDNRIYRETFSALLQSCFPAVRITLAEDGTSALSLTRQHHFDLIILDYQLKAINGGDVVRHLRQRASATSKPMPIIVLMSSQPDIAVFARTLGAAGFLGKPAMEADLLDLLEPLLANLPPAPQTGQPNQATGASQRDQTAWPTRTGGTKPLLWRVRSRTVG